MAWQPSRRPMRRIYSGRGGGGFERSRQAQQALLNEEKLAIEQAAEQRRQTEWLKSIASGGIKSLISAGIGRAFEDPSIREKTALDVKGLKTSQGIAAEDRARVVEKREVEDMKTMLERQRHLFGQSGAFGQMLGERHQNKAAQRHVDKASEGADIEGIEQPPPPGKPDMGVQWGGDLAGQARDKILKTFVPQLTGELPMPGGRPGVDRPGPGAVSPIGEEDVERPFGGIEEVGKEMEGAITALRSQPLTIEQKAAADILIGQARKKASDASALIKTKNESHRSVASYLNATKKQMQGVKPPAGWDGSPEALYEAAKKQGVGRGTDAGRRKGRTAKERKELKTAYFKMSVEDRSKWEHTANIYRTQTGTSLVGWEVFSINDPKEAATIRDIHLTQAGKRGVVTAAGTEPTATRTQEQKLEVEGVKQKGRVSVVKLRANLTSTENKRKAIEKTLADAERDKKTLSNKKELQEKASALRQKENQQKSDLRKGEKRAAQLLREEQKVTTTEKGGMTDITTTTTRKGTKPLAAPDRPKRVPVKPGKTKPKLPVASSAEIDKIVAKGTVSAINAASINLEKTNSLSSSQRTAIRNRKRELRQLKTETTEVQ